MNESLNKITCFIWNRYQIQVSHSLEEVFKDQCVFCEVKASVNGSVQNKTRCLWLRLFSTRTQWWNMRQYLWKSISKQANTQMNTLTQIQKHFTWKYDHYQVAAVYTVMTRLQTNLRYLPPPQILLMISLLQFLWIYLPFQAEL